MIVRRMTSIGRLVLVVGVVFLSSTISCCDGKLGLGPPAFLGHLRSIIHQATANDSEASLGAAGGGSSGNRVQTQNSTGTAGAVQSKQLTRDHNVDSQVQAQAQTQPQAQPQPQPTKRKGIFTYKLNFVERVLKHFFGIFVSDPDIVRITAQITAVVVWSFLGLSCLGTAGFDTKPLLSLLSVAGLTIGFAAKDILTSTFAGLIILFTRPFKRGWVISINGFRGRVMAIDIRYVRLQNTRDHTEILLPLSVVYNNAIIIEKEDIA